MTWRTPHPHRLVSRELLPGRRAFQRPAFKLPGIIFPGIPHKLPDTWGMQAGRGAEQGIARVPCSPGPACPRETMIPEQGDELAPARVKRRR
jgi:hypothetical protein